MIVPEEFEFRIITERKESTDNLPISLRISSTCEPVHSSLFRKNSNNIIVETNQLGSPIQFIRHAMAEMARAR